MLLKFGFAIHPIKIVPLNKRKDGWIKVFSYQPNKKEQFYINSFRKIPIAFFSSYVLLLSELDFINGFGLFCLGLYYTYGSIHIDRKQNKKIRQLYVNQNGVDWAISIQPNIYQRLTQEYWSMNQELKQTLEIPKNQILFKVNIDEIKLQKSILQFDGVESVLRSRERIMKKDLDNEDVKLNNYFELGYKGNVFSINIYDNEQLGFDDYIRALLLRQQLIIK